MPQLRTIVHTHRPDLAQPVPTPCAPAGPVPLVTKAVRALRALRQWQRAGRPLADVTTRARRKAACEACELYRPDGNWGLGECTAPGCNCTNAKRWLLTEKCPHPQGSRWP